jgi:hypothetical protein
LSVAVKVFIGSLQANRHNVNITNTLLIISL